MNLTMVLKWIGYYKLTKENIEKFVPTGAGVYVLGVEKKDGKIRHVYVGQTKSLEDRMFQYLNKDTDNGCLLNHLDKHIVYFKVAEVGLQSDRDACERALYDRYETECNDPDKIPDVEPADINFTN